MLAKAAAGEIVVECLLVEERWRQVWVDIVGKTLPDLLGGKSGSRPPPTMGSGIQNSVEICSKM